jgi:hypothetical protein
VFRPVPGAQVKIGGVELFAGGLELRNLEVGGVMTHEHADGVTLRNVKIAGGLFILSSSRVRILGGSVGGGVDYHPMIAAENATPPRDVLIDGVLFHDWTRTNEGVHTECLQIGAGIGITIRNSTFRNCDVFGLMISTFGAAGAPEDLTIENNVFDAAGDGGYYSVRFSEAAPVWRNVLVRNNSALQPFNVDPKPRKVNFRMIGNVAPLEPWGCVGGISYAYNVWQGVRCGATDVNGRLAFENAAKLDLRLKPGAAGIDVVQKNFAATDIDGRARPAGEAADAGAHESP